MCDTYAHKHTRICIPAVDHMIPVLTHIYNHANVLSPMHIYVRYKYLHATCAYIP